MTHSLRTTFLLTNDIIWAVFHLYDYIHWWPDSMRHWRPLSSCEFSGNWRCISHQEKHRTFNSWANIGVLENVSWCSFWSVMNVKFKSTISCGWLYLFVPFVYVFQSAWSYTLERKKCISLWHKGKFHQEE